MSKYLDELMSQKGENRFENLMQQVKDVFASKHNDKSINTSSSYYTSMSTFTKYLAEFQGVSKVTNVESKHIFGFVEKMQDLGMKNETLKSYVSGIRSFYDMAKDNGCKCRTVVPNNERLHLEERVVGNVERAWSSEEISAAKDAAITQDRLDVYHAINISKHFGTRIDGTCSLTIFQIVNALECNSLIVTEKGGHTRKIPVSKVGRQALIEAKAWAESKDIAKNRVFCQDGKDIGQAKKSIQDWIYNNRDSFQDSSRIASWEARENFKETNTIEKANLSFHGIRHYYASERYNEFKNKGYSDKKARYEVSKIIGHNRDEVTKVYLAKS